MSRGDVTPRRRLSSEESSRIPVPSSPILRRSGSQRLNTFSPIAEHARNGVVNSRTPPLNRHRSLQSLNTPLSSCLSPDRDDDLDSVQSFGSAASVTSSVSQCDHASFARNGTTFSSRQKRYVVHCSPHNVPGEEYLTPTQRANRTIRRLKNLLQDTQTELIEKEQEIFRLTKEVVELRLVKAGSVSVSTIDIAKEERDGAVSSSSTALCRRPPTSQNNLKLSATEVTSSTIAEEEQRQPVTTCVAADQRDGPLYSSEGISALSATLGDVPASLVDSGHFEDLNNAKEWAPSPQSSPRTSQPLLHASATPPPMPLVGHEDRSQFSAIVEKLKKQHEEEIREMREKQNDKVDSLLHRITEANDRYCELRPKLETAETRIRELEQENGELKRTHEESEEKHKAIYLQMYKKGHEAAQFETEIQQANKETENQAVQKTANDELLLELNVTRKELENIKAMYRRLLESRKSTSQQDPEMTLQFLKSAIYYFLTDRENTQGHLAAIESILGFTDSEKLNIEKAYLWR